MYSPKIKEELVRKLYQHKQRYPKPMTDMVNEAVEQYLTNNGGPDVTDRTMVLGPQKSEKLNKSRRIHQNKGG